MLLDFAKKLTRKQWAINRYDIQELQQHWQDAEIAEAIYTISLYNFFNRVAAGFGIDQTLRRVP